MSLESLHRVLEREGARRLAARYPIYALRAGLWPLLGRAEALAARQRAVLDAVRGLPWPVFLNCAGSPHDWALPGTWREGAVRTWGLPGEPSSRLLLEGLLGVGGWRLYLAPHALDPDLLPDAFGGALADLVAFAEGREVPVLLDAWRGNREWRIVVAPAAIPELAAA